MPKSSKPRLRDVASSEASDSSPIVPGGDALGDNAYQRVRDAIAEGKLKPGQRLVENQLAEWLSVSRTPVREAIYRLQAEGLLTQSARQGLIVTRLDYQSVVELYEMRKVLEGTAARSAAAQATEPEIDLLEDIIEMERSLPPDDPESAAHVNRKFHQALHHSAHNRYLLDSLRALDNAMILLGNTTLSFQGRRDEAIAEHERIVAAIRAGDKDAAYKAAEAHIGAAQRKRLNMLMRERD